MRAGIVGGGRAAWFFGRGLQRAGWEIAGVHLRESSKSPISRLLSTGAKPIAELSRESDVVLVAVPDDVLPEIASAVAAVAPAATSLFHASGCLDSRLFGRGNSFSLHPLRALPPAGTDTNILDPLLVFEGDAESGPLAEEIARALGGRMTTIESSQKATYHAAAVFAANYVSSVTDLAGRLLTSAGVAGVEKRDITLLADSALQNWERNDGIARFTGPIVRGDLACVKRHIAALREHPEALRAYVELGLVLAKTARADSPDRTDLQAIESWLSEWTVS